MTYDPSSEAFENQVREDAANLEQVLGEMGRVLVGQRSVASRLVMALLADGHILLEGLPGLAKTTSIKTLAQVASLSFQRIQFTPDLLPADVVGTQIYDPEASRFRVKKGPIFAHLVLADEINRAPAKVQSALLEAMQEKQVTIGEETFFLNEPFLVMATQNPIEQEGTYPLPEAQVDRFLFKVRVHYGNREEEQAIMERAMTGEVETPQAVLDEGAILGLRERVAALHVSEKVRRYIVDVVFASREPETAGLEELKDLIAVGASPRASINLEKAARAQALFQGRTYVTPQDVKDVGADVLRHRILRTYEAEAEDVPADDVVRRIFEGVDVP